MVCRALWEEVRSFIKWDLEEVFQDMSVQELVWFFPNKVRLSTNLALMTFLSMQVTTTLFHGIHKLSLQWKWKIALTYCFLIVMYWLHLFIYSYFYWIHQYHLFAYLFCWNPKLYCTSSYSPNLVWIPLLFQLDNCGDGEQIVYFILEMAVLNDVWTSFNFHLLFHSTSFLCFLFSLINTHV